MDTNEMPELTVNTVEHETTQSFPTQPVQEQESALDDEKNNYKLTDKQFIAELEMNHGLYSQTARSIEKHYGVKFTRQAVYQRASRLQRYRNEFADTLADHAQEVLFDAITRNTDNKQQLKAAMFLLSKTVYRK